MGNGWKCGLIVELVRWRNQYNPISGVVKMSFGICSSAIYNFSTEVVKMLRPSYFYELSFDINKTEY